jgi:hypothetical protein
MRRDRLLGSREKMEENIEMDLKETEGGCGMD